MSPSVRWQLLGLVTVLAISCGVPLFLDKLFARITFLPPVRGPEPSLPGTFVSVAQDLRGAPEIPPEPTGAFRVDFRATFSVDGAPKKTQATIDRIAVEHCDELKRSIASTCQLESEQSTLRVGTLDHNGPGDASVFMRFLVTPKR